MVRLPTLQGLRGRTEPRFGIAAPLPARRVHVCTLRRLVRRVPESVPTSHQHGDEVRHQRAHEMCPRRLSCCAPNGQPSGVLFSVGDVIGQNIALSRRESDEKKELDPERLKRATLCVSTLPLPSALLSAG